MRIVHIIPIGWAIGRRPLPINVKFSYILGNSATNFPRQRVPPSESIRQRLISPKSTGVTWSSGIIGRIENEELISSNTVLKGWGEHQKYPSPRVMILSRGLYLLNSIRLNSFPTRHDWDVNLHSNRFIANSSPRRRGRKPVVGTRQPKGGGGSSRTREKDG